VSYQLENMQLEYCQLVRKESIIGR